MAQPGTGLFWGSLLFSLATAFLIAVPVNRWLISRGKGHAVVMDLHAGHRWRDVHSCVRRRADRS